MAVATIAIPVTTTMVVTGVVATTGIKVTAPEAVMVIEAQIQIVVVTKHQGPKQVILALELATLIIPGVTET
jgi:hypothetical protein